LGKFSAAVFLNLSYHFFYYKDLYIFDLLHLIYLSSFSSPAAVLFLHLKDGRANGIEKEKTFSVYYILDGFLPDAYPFSERTWYLIRFFCLMLFDKS
jgi:hypothetical protein